MEAIRFKFQKSWFCVHPIIASTQKIFLFQLSNGIKNVYTVEYNPNKGNTIHFLCSTQIKHSFTQPSCKNTKNGYISTDTGNIFIKF